MLPYPFAAVVADCMYAYVAANNLGGSDASDLEMPKTAKTQARYVKIIEDIADNVVYYTIGNILI